jgi:ABC-2 type transport system permease protein
VAGKVTPGPVRNGTLSRSAVDVLIARRPVIALWGTGGLAWLLVTTAAYLTAGIAAFRLGEQTAKTRGTRARH